MNAQSPPGTGQSAGLIQTNRTKPFTATELTTIAVILLAVVVMLALDAVYFPEFPASVWATILGAEAEAWVAIVLGIEVWFTFLRFRSAADGTAPPTPTIPPPAQLGPPSDFGGQGPAVQSGGSVEPRQTQ
jgi:hypothetical protein